MNLPPYLETAARIKARSITNSIRNQGWGARGESYHRAFVARVAALMLVEAGVDSIDLKKALEPAPGVCVSCGGYGKKAFAGADWLCGACAGVGSAVR